MPARTPPKLALGTVQFGLPYGLVRPDRPVWSTDVQAILDIAWRNGIDMLDTAADYGDAESVIAALRPSGSQFRIVSKTTSIGRSDITQADVDRVVARVHQSLGRLRVATLDALLVHHADDLLALGSHGLYRALAALKSQGFVRRIGVSVYDPATLCLVLDQYDIDVVQLPLNLLDQRFLRDGTLDELTRRGIEVHAR